MVVGVQMRKRPHCRDAPSGKTRSWIARRNSIHHCIEPLIEKGRVHAPHITALLFPSMPSPQQYSPPRPPTPLFKRLTHICLDLVGYALSPNTRRSPKPVKSVVRHSKYDPTPCPPDSHPPEVNMITEREAAASAPSPTAMAAFDIVAVGVGGGPDETNLSA